MFTEELHTYSAKIINPSKKSDYNMLKKFRVSIRFTNVESLKKSLSECFPTYVSKDAVDIQVTYVSPGHGARGRHQWISDNLDIEDMYMEY